MRLLNLAQTVSMAPDFSLIETRSLMPGIILMDPKSRLSAALSLGAQPEAQSLKIRRLSLDHTKACGKTNRLPALSMYRTRRRERWRSQRFNLILPCGRLPRPVRLMSMESKHFLSALRPLLRKTTLLP